MASFEGFYKANDCRFVTARIESEGQVLHGPFYVC